MSPEKAKVYMGMAYKIKELSPDEETKVGAIMLSPDGRIIASSYNGFLRGAEDDELPKTRPDKYKFMQHAERNMLYNCCYEGIKTRDTTIFCTLSPCEECVRACFQSGVRYIYFSKLYKKFDSIDFYANMEDVTINIEKVGSYVRLDMLPVKGK